MIQPFFMYNFFKNHKVLLVFDISGLNKEQEQNLLKTISKYNKSYFRNQEIHDIALTKMQISKEVQIAVLDHDKLYFLEKPNKLLAGAIDDVIENTVMRKFLIESVINICRRHDKNGLRENE